MDDRAYVGDEYEADGTGGAESDVMLYSVRRRVDAWLVTVLLAVVFTIFVGIVPSDSVRPLLYAERVYLVSVLAAGLLLVVGYTATVADVRVAINSTLFYAIFCAGVVPRHAYLVSLDGSARIEAPYFPLYLGLAGLVYLLLCIVQRRFPGDVIVMGDDPVLNLHHAMDLMHGIFVLKAFRGATNYSPYYKQRPTAGASTGEFSRLASQHPVPRSGATLSGADDPLLRGPYVRRRGSVGTNMGMDDGYGASR